MTSFRCIILLMTLYNVVHAVHPSAASLNSTNVTCPETMRLQSEFNICATVNLTTLIDCTARKKPVPSNPSLYVDHDYIQTCGDALFVPALQMCAGAYYPVGIRHTVKYRCADEAQIPESLIGLPQSNTTIHQRSLVSSCDQRIVGGAAANMSGVVQLCGVHMCFCGGFSYHDGAVVTAAHCAKPGLDRVCTDRTMTQCWPVSNYLRHPDYDESTFANDIAVLVTTMPKIGCLVLGDVVDTMQVYGMGVTDVKTMHLATQWLYVNLSVVPCTLPSDDLTNFCMWADGYDSCYGDSGGPVIYPLYDANVVAGIVSYGSGCGNDIPGVYLKLSEYRLFLADYFQNLESRKLQPLPQSAFDAMPPAGVVVANVTHKYDMVCLAGLPTDSYPTGYAASTNCDGRVVAIRNFKMSQYKLPNEQFARFVATFDIQLSFVQCWPDPVASRSYLMRQSDWNVCYYTHTGAFAPVRMAIQGEYTTRSLAGLLVTDRVDGITVLYKSGSTIRRLTAYLGLRIQPIEQDKSSTWNLLDYSTWAGLTVQPSSPLKVKRVDGTCIVTSMRCAIMGRLDSATDFSVCTDPCHSVVGVVNVTVKRRYLSDELRFTAMPTAYGLTLPLYSVKDRKLTGRVVPYEYEDLNPIALMWHNISLYVYISSALLFAFLIAIIVGCYCLQRRRFHVLRQKLVDIDNTVVEIEQRVPYSLHGSVFTEGVYANIPADIRTEPQLYVEPTSTNDLVTYFDNKQKLP